MKQALVTGGAGFIGSYLCECLLASGYKVICVDNLFTGSANNVAHLTKNEHFTFLPHDIVKPLFLQQHVDEIYHFACPASPIHYQQNPIKTIKTNILGTVNMLGLAKLHNAQFLQASTSEVYGDPVEHPQKESYWGNVNPIGSRSCYDEGKRAAETLCFDYHRQHGVQIKVIRIFNTYGPRMALNDGRVVSNFILQALQNKPITIYGDGKQTRSFCYITDLARGIFSMMNILDFKGPVNLGNPHEFTILELAEKVIELTGSKSQLVFKPLPEDDPQQRRPDIALANEKLGWKPEVRLEEGLQKTIAYFKGVLG